MAITIDLCPSQFVDQCRKDEAFQRKHGQACIEIFVGKRKDDPICAKHDPIKCTTPEEAAVVGPDCSKLERDYDRIVCQLEFPKCAKSAVELVKTSNSLISDVDRELGRYKELLELDLDSIGDRAALCRFSGDQLNQYYVDATDDASSITLLGTRSLDIEKCSAAIEQWVESRSQGSAGGTNNDVLQDNLIRGTQQELEPLKASRKTLNVSMGRLAEAGPKIEALIGYHFAFCGEPAQNTSSETK